jgi:hypothetical protein
MAIVLDGTTGITTPGNLSVTGANTGIMSIVAPNTAVNRTITLPDATTTLVGTDNLQILSNKFFLTTNTVLAATPTGTASIEIGAGRTGNGPAYFDLVGDTTYSDYGTRFIRQATSSGASTLTHRGTGNIEITAQEAAPIVFSTTNTERMRIDSVGNLLFNSGYGSVATAYGCRAWVNFNGTGTVAIVGSGNVSSITDNGVGLYTVNFTTAMPDANYVAVCNGNQSAAGGDTTRTLVSPIASLAGSHQIQTGSGASSGRFDFAVVSVSIFR